MPSTEEHLLMPTNKKRLLEAIEQARRGELTAHEFNTIAESEGGMSENNDLVRRLREEAQIVPHEVFTWLNPLLLEAALEIERLRATVERQEIEIEWRPPDPTVG